MKPSSSKTSYKRERRTYSEEYDRSSDKEYRAYLARRRKEWLRQQELLKQHEELKKKKIMEFEAKLAKQSKSPTAVMSNRLESIGSTISVFKGPEGSKIDYAKLSEIKVDIHRKVPNPRYTEDIVRDIVKPEDIIIKRRNDEGSKPIFDREELKSKEKPEEIEATTNRSSSVERIHVRRRSVGSHGPTRSRQTIDARKREEGKSEKRYQSHNSLTANHHRKADRSSSNHYHRPPYSRSRSLSRDHERKNVSYKRIERSRRNHRSRSRSRERSRSLDSYKKKTDKRNKRDRSPRERGPPLIQQIPVPVFYGGYTPAPMMSYEGLMPIRAPPPLTNSRNPRFMRPARPFPPRFIPPNPYGMGLPPNPRFRPMFPPHSWR
ncbi:luc7-like protein 3 [Prorops nasuta]|uniref:luc7-like protein 3 n=1 Tax=Prorops nasuta TaxID=863751 RepID=UPI0034CF3CA0